MILSEKKQMPCHSSSEKHKVNLRFIDLFAGIGGFRLAFEQMKAECVFSSEWDKFAKQTYMANFNEIPHGDIRTIDAAGIPDHDILCAGFPCQPFSIAGVSKKQSLGRSHGFQDTTQGTLFFDMARILHIKKPQAFLLENVKNLLSHDKGNTFREILKILNELGYHIRYQVMDASSFVPQHRERIYIIGFQNPVTAGLFAFPESKKNNIYLSSILEKNVPAKYTLSDHLWNYLQAYKEKHRASGNGFGYGLAGLDGITRTLSARYHKDGSEILIPQKGNPRRLTPRECARLMGFPDSFKIVVSDTQAYRQFGNSVVVPVVGAIARQMIQAIKQTELKPNVSEKSKTGEKESRKKTKQIA